MLCSAVDLKNAFLAFVKRLEKTEVSVSSEEDGKNVQVQRSYSGDFTDAEIRTMGIKSQAGIANLEQSKIKFDDVDICVFLNMGWERIYNAKMKQVSKFLMDPKVMPTEMDSIIHEHQGLTFQSQLIQETTHERFGSSKATGNTVFKGVNEEKTMDNARIFKIPDTYQQYGPLTIVTLTIEEFDTDNPWLTTDTPLHTRIARPIGNNDLASLGALAKNSRYASGGLYRHKKWMDIHGDTYDILEVFHNNEEEDKWYNPFDGAYLFVAFQYIAYPQPLSIGQLNGSSPRTIEVTYGYEIAKVAAEIALGKGQ